MKVLALLGVARVQWLEFGVVLLCEEVDVSGRFWRGEEAMGGLWGGFEWGRHVGRGILSIGIDGGVDVMIVLLPCKSGKFNGGCEAFVVEDEVWEGMSMGEGGMRVGD